MIDARNVNFFVNQKRVPMVGDSGRVSWRSVIKLKVMLRSSFRVDEVRSWSFRGVFC